jgi:hypothetical protein
MQVTSEIRLPRPKGADQMLNLDGVDNLVVAGSDVWVTDRFGQLIHIDPSTNRARVVELTFDFGLRRR